jgi:CDP-glycerol glycerophosphotransferase (TagB/SpsB family)
MPTWRRHLGLENEMSWSVRPDFHQSTYVTKWRELLNSAALRGAADSIGARIEFCLHPNFSSHADAFAPPSHITIVDAKQAPSLQAHLRNCAAFVTDYSSMAFDAAYAGKPVVYYQFDRPDFFGGLHLGSEGYFDFDRDGFGPVARDIDQAMGAIVAAVSGKGSEVYDARRDAFFAFRDQMNCKRVTGALMAMTVGNQHA